MEKLFFGIFSRNGRLITENLTPGERVYGEELVSEEGREYRVWNPRRSKLAAAIKNRLEKVPLQNGGKVLYLGSAEGTTVSHVSDIVGKEGVVFGVDISERVLRKFIEVCESRPNIIPVLGDANMPESYAEYLEGTEIDLLYQDVAQKNQAEIFNKNAEMYLRKGKFGLIAIKAKSISQKFSSEDVFEMEINKLKEEFNILQAVALNPFEKDHCMVLCEKK